MHLGEGAEKLIAKLEQNPATCWSDVILNFLTRVRIHHDRIEMQLNSHSLAQSIFGNKAASTSDDNDAEDDKITLTISATLKRTGKELRFVIPGAANQATPDRSLIRLLQRAHALQSAIEHSASASIEEIAASRNMTPSYATRLMRLNYLAPDIAAAILDGNQPLELSAKRLMKDTRYPLGWHEQRIALGFAQA